MTDAERIQDARRHINSAISDVGNSPAMESIFDALILMTDVMESQQKAIDSLLSS